MYKVYVQRIIRPHRSNPHECEPEPIRMRSEEESYEVLKISWLLRWQEPAH